ncbi:hypothetical protein TEQG_08019 [Trichophyton equinum CBS 127.97]|uniref:Uncharacterized protein n=1 Tax=Trichophyton equinum (strain ATCC MYA-4606 / CBS 127.97) TaxID=559882 RepID=F2Q4Y6_TRIEC|nr:hypothetical protein TEQG_08019 [Trichophyton equinum CBS 127.97]
MQPSNAIRTFTRIPSHLVSLEGGDVPFSYHELLTEYKRRPAFTDTISSPTKTFLTQGSAEPQSWLNFEECGATSWHQFTLLRIEPGRQNISTVEEPPVSTSHGSRTKQLLAWYLDKQAKLHN